MKIYVCILSIVLLVTVFLFADNKKDKIKIEMPDGFENIEIGMSVHEFRKLRPNAEMPFAKIDDKDRVIKELDNLEIGEKGFVESNISNNTILKSAGFLFKDGKLCFVSIYSNPEKVVELRKKSSKLIKWCIKKWDSDFTKKIEIVGDTLEPMLFWKKGDIELSVSFQKSSSNTAFILMRIYDTKEDDLKQYFKEKVLTEKEKEEIFNNTVLFDDTEIHKLIKLDKR